MFHVEHFGNFFVLFLDWAGVRGLSRLGGRNVEINNSDPFFSPREVYNQHLNAILTAEATVALQG